jgi:hypothetical protein
VNLQFEIVDKNADTEHSGNNTDTGQGGINEGDADERPEEEDDTGEQSNGN